jgi:rhodanese-related sulfurtransferase
MSIKRVSPQEAQGLLHEGWRYLDVRSIPEYEQGHPPGAYNVPLMHFLPGRGMTPNPDFAQVVGKHFQSGDRLVLGCKMGPRSLRAAELLASLGFSQVVDVLGGFEEWKSKLPVETTTPPGRGWEELKK